jgi:hypothetical protein
MTPAIELLRDPARSITLVEVEVKDEANDVRLGFIDIPRPRERVPLAREPIGFVFREPERHLLAFEAQLRRKSEWRRTSSDAARTCARSLELSDALACESGLELARGGQNLQNEPSARRP